MAFLFNLGQALPAHLVGRCGSRAVSRKTPIYFIKKGPKKSFPGTGYWLLSVWLQQYSILYFLGHLVHLNIDSLYADQIVPFQNRGLSFAIPFSDMQ